MPFVLYYSQSWNGWIYLWWIHVLKYASCMILWPAGSTPLCCISFHNTRSEWLWRSTLFVIPSSLSKTHNCKIILLNFKNGWINIGTMLNQHVILYQRWFKGYSTLCAQLVVMVTDVIVPRNHYWYQIWKKCFRNKYAKLKSFILLFLGRAISSRAVGEIFLISGKFVFGDGFWIRTRVLQRRKYWRVTNNNVLYPLTARTRA